MADVADDNFTGLDLKENTIGIVLDGKCADLAVIHNAGNPWLPSQQIYRVLDCLKDLIRCNRTVLRNLVRMSEPSPMASSV